MVKSWKTGAAGIGAILAAIAALATGYATGTLTAEMILMNGAAVVSGIGLIFGKDWNVTGK